MPPRPKSHRVPINNSMMTSLRSSLCSQCIRRVQQRQFSSTPQNASVLRQEMFRWLKGPGKVFKNPLPGSTNYLNAYDSAGSLLRARWWRATDENVEEMNRNREEGEDRDNGKGNEDAKDDEGRTVQDTANARGNRKPLAEKLVKEREATQSNRDMGLPPEKGVDLMPFPMNSQFRSQPVLSEGLKDEIYNRIVEQKKTVRDVSAALGVEMKRIGAVIRLKAVEKEWEQENKFFATPYADAIRAMLPQTPFVRHDPIPHESINDLPYHRATDRQVFLPVPESRPFTRRDAGALFEDYLLPAEARIPHPELYEDSKWAAEGLVAGERARLRKEADQKEADAKERLDRRRKETERLRVKKAQTPRWEFRFREKQADRTGEHGKREGRLGVRYGMPHEDRKKGQIKIPTRVDT